MPEIAAHRGPTPSGPGFRVDVSETVDAPADTVWDVLGRRFADIDAWSSVVRESRPLAADEVGDAAVAPAAPVPGRRTVTGPGALSEVLVEYDDVAHVFTFDTLDLPGPLRLAQNRTSVEATADGGSVVRSDVRIVLHPLAAPLARPLRRRMARTFGGVLRDLRSYVEAGVAP